jgi:uncharacterized protein involved in tellurium resistance
MKEAIILLYIFLGIGDFNTNDEKIDLKLPREDHIEIGGIS